jgi:hypothetical protein
MGEDGEHIEVLVRSNVRSLGILSGEGSHMDRRKGNANTQVLLRIKHRILDKFAISLNVNNLVKYFLRYIILNYLKLCIQ